ncbi:MAG: RNA-binding cell elongation regulator Jag/EloR [Acidimicrobiia bacterium]
MEWVEVKGSSVEIAVEAALQELGLSSADQAEVEIVQEPDRGFLGIGGRPAIVRVKPKPKRGGRQRRRRRGRESEPEARQPSRSRQAPRRSRDGGRRKEGGRTVSSRDSVNEQEHVEADVDQQAAVVGEFLEGLLGAFGLEGQVATRVEEGIIYADVTGEQTEALVGPKGEILQAVNELTRTVVQRHTRAGTRLRLDIAGYGERRREALRIYAERLAQRVLDEGVEVMLEPMNPGDRKVVHDAVLETEGVRSYSEGEEPHRSVVIGLAPGFRAEPSPAEDEEQPDAGA